MKYEEDENHKISEEPCPECGAKMWVIFTVAVECDECDYSLMSG